LVAWYENEGSQSFTERVITTLADGARSVFALDVDGDGDDDALSASYDDDTVAWYENDCETHAPTTALPTSTPTFACRYTRGTLYNENCFAAAALLNEYIGESFLSCDYSFSCTSATGDNCYLKYIESDFCSSGEIDILNAFFSDAVFTCCDYTSSCTNRMLLLETDCGSQVTELNDLGHRRLGHIVRDGHELHVLEC
jgi:hypothetical protein